MFWKFSLVNSAFAAFATFYILATGTNDDPSSFWNDRFSFIENLVLMAIPITWLIGPYAGMGGLAFWLRSNRRLSARLFGIFLLLSIIGVTLLAADQAVWIDSDNRRMGQRVAPFLIAFGQWAAVALVALITVPIFYFSKANPKQIETEDQN